MSGEANRSLGDGITCPRCLGPRQACKTGATIKLDGTNAPELSILASIA